MSAFVTLEGEREVYVRISMAEHERVGCTRLPEMVEYFGVPHELNEDLWDNDGVRAWTTSVGWIAHVRLVVGHVEMDPIPAPGQGHQ